MATMDDPLVTLHLDDVIPQFIQWGLLDPADVVNGDVAVTSVARRNLNLRLQRPNKTALLFKQPDPAVPDSGQSLRNELGFYTFCQHEPRASEVAGWMPRLGPAPEAEELVVVEWADGAVTFAEHLWQARDGELPTTAASAVGRALATLHRTFARTDLAADPRLAGLTHTLPASFSLNRPPPSILQRLSGAQHRLLQMVQEAGGFSDALARARATWRPSTVIHGDVRSSNVLVLSTKTASDPARCVLLVDWELVRRGDPAFDLGGVLASFTRVWLAGLPLASGLEPDERVAAAQIPAATLHPPIRAFWSDYRETYGCTAGEAADLLRRALLCSGTVLVQSAWELSLEDQRPSSLAVLLLQLASNLLTDTERHAATLFGIVP